MSKLDILVGILQSGKKLEQILNLSAIETIFQKGNLENME